MRGTSKIPTNKYFTNKFAHLQLPISNEEELQRVELTCSIREGNEDLAHIMSLAGGDSVNEAVNLMLRKLLTKDISMEYSLKGRQNKRAFYKLRIYKILTDAVRVRVKSATHTTFDAVRVRVKSATDADIHKHVGRWLAVAGDREGGRKKRNVLSENYVH
ncbi:protein of unknown function (DUF4806) [Popillia japonica]|uniref:DUF4806 domain-containing protein n=1 Tax=Popillia japonica TaxID=7064 RepID=A0AAW1IGE6_POPJA